MNDEASRRVESMLDGFRVPQCIHTVCTLGLPDDVPNEGIDTSALARISGTEEGALRRLLRALSSVGIFETDGADRWQHTAGSRALRKDHPSGLHDRAIGLGALAWASWGQLAHSIRTGRPAFDAVHGAPFFAVLQRHPPYAEAFGRTMSSWTRQTARDVLDAFSFAGIEHLVDIGGGHGIMLDAILAATPAMRATLIDRPEVIEAAAPALQDPQRSRCKLVALDAFADPIPAADAYLLSWILHDWDDHQCVDLLARCVRSNTNARIIVVEMLLDHPTASTAATWFDLEMLVQTGGRERTLAEYADLFARAGRPGLDCTHTRGTHSVLVSTNP